MRSGSYVQQFCVLMLKLISIGCATQPDASEDSNYVVIAGVKMRKVNANVAEILWAGVKRDDGRNGFDPKFLPLLDAAIDAPQRTEAFNHQTRKIAADAAADAGLDTSELDLGGQMSNGSETKGTLRIFRLLRVDDFVEQLNSEKNWSHLSKLSRQGADPRVITSVATVFDRSSSAKMNASGKVRLKVRNADGEAEVLVKAEGSEETLANLSDGTVFAYEFSRICWEKQNGKLRVFTLEVDRPGPDDHCPRGTKDDASKL
jgi:hypothetical protein